MFLVVLTSTIMYKIVLFLKTTNASRRIERPSVRTILPKRTNNVTQPSTHRGPFKYRPPEDSEQFRRIIDSVPMSWNPNTRRWDKVITPDSGLQQSINLTPPTSITIAPPSLASTASSAASYTTHPTTTQPTTTTSTASSASMESQRLSAW